MESVSALRYWFFIELDGFCDRCTWLKRELARNYHEIYPIAARCGVSAKTDIQPDHQKVPLAKTDGPIFQAVNQTISGLARGKPIL